MLYIAVHPALEAITKSKFEFHLTGSQFLGTAGNHSDYDFYIVDCGSTLSEFLCAAWFKNVEDGGLGYCADRGLRSRWRWSQVNYNPVDVLVVPDTETLVHRTTVMNKIRERKYFELMSLFKGRGLEFYQLCKLLK